ncbi:zinc finger protein 3 [Arabidopsis thaliana]|uniref:Isoform 2 of Zinc finger CCCH domain-containing protein 57 n=1 Tax=Arabidopsis thaliana TaxID=3702 RepID=Q8L7N8-2|nr:zinc finger nuclease 3 [Arabidopsis thaliana]AAD27875.1 zinc finger protein 3 [Arabidopsis thaliana]AED92306.1 zinc finger nuclease 3 [Arabidopsis thaliana]BAB09623.1 zinc finger protein 3 [Arabidopsis thaliana]|eukprot:NP_568332.2 zinc finger nuclease 3 [Arabidopsis thaliana]
MDFDSISRESTFLSPLLNQNAMWQMNLGSDDTMGVDGSYPERHGEPDCAYYIRTGLCRFGSTCRFNHPHDRKLVIATARIKGEYPERIGQPECEFYLKTGTCKFGVTCKFHHPRNKAGIDGSVSVNVLSYPLRPNEDDCSYFLRIGQCKFGGTCKFNHPQTQSTNLMVSVRGSPVYSALQSLTGQPSYSWSRTSFVANPPRLQDPSGFASGSQGGLFSSGFHSGNSVPLGFYALPRENVFPERPGQPECQFYMKTGDCKFGTVCKFHHPRDRQTPPPDCVLSSGEPLCVFYSRYGICKFGPSCKFDHPMRVFTYNNNTASPSPSSSLHQETAITTELRNLLVSSSVEAKPTSLPETTSAKDTIVDAQH